MGFPPGRRVPDFDGYRPRGGGRGGAPDLEIRHPLDVGGHDIVKIDLGPSWNSSPYTFTAVPANARPAPRKPPAVAGPWQLHVAHPVAAGHAGRRVRLAFHGVPRGPGSSAHPGWAAQDHRASQNRTSSMCDATPHLLRQPCSAKHLMLHQYCSQCQEWTTLSEPFGSGKYFSGHSFSQAFQKPGRLFKFPFIAIFFSELRSFLRRRQGARNITKTFPGTAHHELTVDLILREPNRIPC